MAIEKRCNKPHISDIVISAHTCTAALTRELSFQALSNRSFRHQAQLP